MRRALPAGKCPMPTPLRGRARAGIPLGKRQQGFPDEAVTQPLSHILGLPGLGQDRHFSLLFPSCRGGRRSDEHALRDHPYEGPMQGRRSLIG
jgi:hypothetical protein